MIVGTWTDMRVGYPHRRHFMVLAGMDNDFVFVNDPGKTKGKDNKYTIVQFEKAWSDQKCATVTIHGH